MSTNTTIYQKAAAAGYCDDDTHEVTASDVKFYVADMAYNMLDTYGDNFTLADIERAVQDCAGDVKEAAELLNEILADGYTWEELAAEAAIRY